MRRQVVKREADLQIISSWIGEGARVLDMGCGRGIFLEHLRQTKGCYAMGVDSSFEKILGCVKRGVPAYHGDIEEMLAAFPDGFFDWVVCSRTLQELERPKEVITQALRVGERFAVGFVNYGFWANRLSYFMSGRRVRNEVFPHRWETSRPANPLSVDDFEEFCTHNHLKVTRRCYLGADWRQECRLLPNLRAGYVLYELTK